MQCHAWERVGALWVLVGLGAGAGAVVLRKWNN
jgi:hypothetical protein